MVRNYSGVLIIDMKKIIFLFTAIVFTLANYAQDDKQLINAIALPNGSFMYETPPSLVETNSKEDKIVKYSPRALFDLSSQVWSSKKNNFPLVFIMELTEDYMIEKMVFDNRCESAKVSSKDVKVEFSTDSARGSYKSISTFNLKENEVNTFTFEPSAARWIKISILSNYGSKSNTQLAEVEAYGVHRTEDIKMIDLKGRWQSNWGWVDLYQSGNSIMGNYEFNNGKIPYGGVERNKITYRWIEPQAEGWVTLFLNKEGTRFTGVWCYGKNWNQYGFWVLTRETGTPMEPLVTIGEPPPVATPAPVNKDVVQAMQKDLKKEGKLILYGINFKLNSSEILTSSFSVLNEVAELLKADGGLKIRIEGHTDNTGSDDYNIKLSSSRAEAVKKYLTEKHSIDSARLETIGKGESMPIADNTTESGKASNRRVEIHQR